jgi:copper resistance protein C
MDQLDTTMTSRTLSTTAAGLIIASATLLTAALTFAHAFPTAEEPRVGSTLSTPPSRVTITYDAPIESLFATLQVLDGSGHDQAVGRPQVGSHRRQLSIALKPVAPGSYTVKWAVVAEDGHRTEGSYIFTVAAGALQ